MTTHAPLTRALLLVCSLHLAVGCASDAEEDAAADDRPAVPNPKRDGGGTNEPPPGEKIHLHQLALGFLGSHSFAAPSEVYTTAEDFEDAWASASSLTEPVAPAPPVVDFETEVVLGLMPDVLGTETPEQVQAFSEMNGHLSVHVILPPQRSGCQDSGEACTTVWHPPSFVFYTLTRDVMGDKEALTLEVTAEVEKRR